jgi:hypothetical protein
MKRSVDHKLKRLNIHIETIKRLQEDKLPTVAGGVGGYSGSCPTRYQSLQTCHC